jgi:hypothetical protein
LLVLSRESGDAGVQQCGRDSVILARRKTVTEASKNLALQNASQQFERETGRNFAPF